MSSSLLWRPQVAVLQADGIGLHRVGVYLSLVDKPALGAPQGPVLEPERAEAICWISMRDWHLGQRGRPATRGDKLGVCGSGNRCLPLNLAGALPNSLSPMDAGTVR